MQFLLKTVAHRIQIFRRLGIFRETAYLGFAHQFRKLCTSYFFQFFLSCKNIHRKLFKISKIQIIHFIEYRNIFQQLHLMVVQCFHNLIHIFFSFRILCLHRFNFIRCFLKYSKKSFALFFIKALQFSYNIRKQCTNFSQIL